MTTTIQKYLVIIDARIRFWKEETARQMELGCNFILISASQPFELDQLGETLALSAAELPKKLTPADFFLLSSYVHPKAFDIVLLAQEGGNAVFFIEQLKLPSNSPPRCKPYLVYCSIRGIISQHEHLARAKQSCADYLTKVSLLREYPEAGIYHWRGEEGWSNLIDHSRMVEQLAHHQSSRPQIRW